MKNTEVIRRIEKILREAYKSDRSPIYGSREFYSLDELVDALLEWREELLKELTPL